MGCVAPGKKNNGTAEDASLLGYYKLSPFRRIKLT